MVINIQGEIQSNPLNTNFNDLQNQIDNLQSQVDTNKQDIETKLQSHKDSTTAHNSNNIVNGSSVTGNNVSEAINNLKTIVDNITTVDSNANIGVYSATDNINTNNYSATISGLSYFGGLKINLTVANANTDTATLDINGLGAKTIKIRKSDGTKVDAPAGSVKGIVQLEYDGTDFILINGEVEEYSPELTQNSSIFTLGTGKDENGQDVDISSSVTEGQVSVGLKGQTWSNRVKNSDFENDFTNWNTYGSGATATIETDIKIYGNKSMKIVFTTTNQYRKYQDIIFPTEHKIYVVGFCNITTTSDAGVSLYTTDYGSMDTNRISSNADTNKLNVWQKLSLIKEVINDGIRVQFGRVCGGDVTAYFDGFMAIDLTELFGAGNEPTKEWCDQNLHYINGTKSTVCATRVKSVGKNLANENKIKTFDVYEPAIWNGEKIYLDNSGNTNTRSRGQIKVWLKNGQQYIAKKFNEVVISGAPASINITEVGSSMTTKSISNNVAFTWDKPTGVYALNVYTDQGSLQQCELNIQIEEGDTATKYEPYKESVRYYTLPDGVDGLHSLPNGTKDEISDDGRLIKRVSNDYIVQNTDFTVLYTSNPNVDVVRFDTQLLNNYTKKRFEKDFRFNGIDYCEKTSINDFTTDDIGKVAYQNSSQYHDFIVAKGQYANLAEAQANILSDYGITTLNYQLAEPKTYDLDVTPINSYPNGTLIVEPYLRKAIKYDATTGNGLDFPVALSEIEKIEDINGNEIDLANVTLSADGKSTTITGASDNEIYTVYGYIKPEESTIPETVHKTPINTKATIKDNNAMIQKHGKNILDLQDQVAMLIVLNS